MSLLPRPKPATLQPWCSIPSPSVTRRILILAAAPAQLLDLTGPAEVFSQASRLATAPLYDIEAAVVPTGTRRAPTTTSGVRLATGRALVALVAGRRPLDTLIIAGSEGAQMRNYRRASHPLELHA